MSISIVETARRAVSGNLLKWKGEIPIRQKKTRQRGVSLQKSTGNLYLGETTPRPTEVDTLLEEGIKKEEK